MTSSDDDLRARFDQRVRELHGDLMALRMHFRLMLATAHANPARWFGGSLVLRYACYQGLRTDVLARVRRLGLKGQDDEHSLYQVLMLQARIAGTETEAGRARAAAENSLRILASPPGLHIKRLTNKAVAHAGILTLRRLTSDLPGLRADQYNIRTVAEVVAALSRFYEEYVGPPHIALDPIDTNNDPLLQVTQDQGVPVEDFEPGAIFRAGAPDVSRPHATIPHDEWEALAVHFPKPWPKQAVRLDLHFQWNDRSAKGRLKHSDPAALAARWGWDEADVLRAMFGDEGFRIPQA